MKSRRERTLEAYRDGQLSARQRARVDRWLVSDEASRHHLERGEALGRIVREAWREGPPAPSPERIMAAIRPALRVIDLERASRPSLWQRMLGVGVRGRGAWNRGSLEWASALGMVTASLMAIVLASAPAEEVRREAQHVVAMPAGPEFMGQVGWPGSVYDLADSGEPLIVYENEGATVIYLGQDLEVDDLSWDPMLEGWA